MTRTRSAFLTDENRLRAQARRGEISMRSVVPLTLLIASARELLRSSQEDELVPEAFGKALKSAPVKAWLKGEYYSRTK